MSDFAKKLRHLVIQSSLRSLAKFDEQMLRCESPIEELLAVALWLRGNFADISGQGVNTLESAKNASKVWEKAVLATQVSIEQYRVDLLAVEHYGDDEPCTALAIECDGHDFHEKTKEQAARDKARDRALSAAGVKVLRFTGSEIWKDADGCAAEVFSCMYAEFTEMLSRRSARPVPVDRYQ